MTTEELALNLRALAQRETLPVARKVLEESAVKLDEMTNLLELRTRALMMLENQTENSVSNAIKLLTYDS